MQGLDRWQSLFLKSHSYLDFEARNLKVELVEDIIIPNIYVFDCVEVLRPSQPNGVMSSAVSLPNHTFTGQA